MSVPSTSEYSDRITDDFQNMFTTYGMFKGEGFLRDSAVLVDGMGILSRLLPLHYVALCGISQTNGRGI